MDKLIDIISHGDTKYEKDNDYKFFYCTIIDNLGKNINKKN